MFTFTIEYLFQQNEPQMIKINGISYRARQNSNRVSLLFQKRLENQKEPI